MRKAFIILLLFALASASDNRWWPDTFTISNVRLNASYPIVDNTYYCEVDTFPINDSSVSTATFVIYGAGIDINASENDSIGYQKPGEPMTWRSVDFTPTSTGNLECNVSLVDAYTTTKTATKTVLVANELGTCGEGPTCNITAATDTLPGIYHYYSIYVNGSGSITQSLTESEYNAYGENYTFYVDTNFTLAGTMTLSGSGTKSASKSGMQAGALYIYANEDFNQSGAITSVGVAGIESSNIVGNGGDALDIYVEADRWLQSGALTRTGGAGPTPSCNIRCSGGTGGNAGFTRFKGRLWESSGNWAWTSGAGGSGDAIDGGNGAASGNIEGIEIYGILNRTGGTHTLTVGTPGNGVCDDGAAGRGGSAGTLYVFKYVEGALYMSSTGAWTVTAPKGGAADACDYVSENGGAGSTGLFMYFNGTDFIWKAATITITLGNGGNGQQSGVQSCWGGNGGTWLISGNTTYEGMRIRDYSNITTAITLNGGTGGGGSGCTSGTNGDSAGWEAMYNRVKAGNDFTKLLPSRTTYNLSTDTTFGVNATLADTVTLASAQSTMYALDYMNLTWTSTNGENQTLYYDLNAINNATGESIYPFQISNAAPTPLRTNTTTSYPLDTDRYNLTQYIVYVRERGSYYRFTAWTSKTVDVLHANSSIRGNASNVSGSGSISFTCNLTGYLFYNNGSQFLENTSVNKTIPLAFVTVNVENSGANTTYNATYSATTDTYTATGTGPWAAGNHSWWCLANKPNYKDAVSSAYLFNTTAFSVNLPTGVDSVDFICFAPTITDVEPIGQTSTSPIFTVVNNNLNATKNYTVRLSTDPAGASIYFTRNYSRTTQYLLNSTANKTACVDVPVSNTTACQVWLWADCSSATVITGQELNFIWGETS